MAIQIPNPLSFSSLLPKVNHVFELAGEKILNLDRTWDTSQGTPVFTIRGKYTTRGWTEWTQGFQYGMALLQYDATGEKAFLDLGRLRTRKQMASHVSHIGVHDHGFNNVSTYGNLLRLMMEGRIPWNEDEKDFLELALKVSGAVQAARWTPIHGGGGFIHSFNGPHSLFIDTVRSLRALAVAHGLGHVLMGECDERISLLGRLVQHADATARYAVYYGEGRDAYDVRGRTAHESVFNCKDGRYRCPNSQQGYSPFSTWTRGQAWAICGYAEQLEFLETLSDEALSEVGGRDQVEALFLRAALATSDFYLEETPTCGVPYWDTGAPGLARLTGWSERPADPENDQEPVDSSAAAIAGQGLIRLGRYLIQRGRKKAGQRYLQAGLKVADTLFSDTYLSLQKRHQGLLLHSVYHRPNGWDYIPKGRKVPFGESSMWGDYHAMELALLIQRESIKRPWLTFFSCLNQPE